MSYVPYESMNNKDMNNELRIDAEKLSPKEQFLLRKQIVTLRKRGKATTEVVEILDVTVRHAQSTRKKYSERLFRMIRFEVDVNKSNISDKIQTVGDNSKFVYKMKVVVYVWLFIFSFTEAKRRHNTISHFMHIYIGIDFVVGFEPLDDRA